MESETQRVDAKGILTLVVVGRGRNAKTLYLKVPHDLNKGLGFAPGDAVQIAIMAILSKGDLKGRREE